MAKWFLATPWKAFSEMAAKHCCCPHWSCCDVPSFGLNTKELLITLGWAQSACPPSHSLTSSSHYLLSRHLFLSFISNLNPPWDFYFGSLLSRSHSHWPHVPSSALRTMLSTQLLTLASHLSTQEVMETEVPGSDLWTQIRKSPECHTKESRLL